MTGPVTARRDDGGAAAGGADAARSGAGPASPTAGPEGNDRYDERDHERFALIPAAYVLLRRGTAGPADDAGGGPAAPGAGEVLLQLRQNTGYRDGYWACAAAGHVEEGESVVAAAVREVREELGVRVDPTALRPLTVLHRGEPGGPAIEQRADFFFEVTAWEGVPAIQEPEKAAGLAWAPLDGLPDPVVPHEAAVLAAVHARETGGASVPPLMTFGFGETA